MDDWQWVLLAVAGYVAVSSLIRLMLRHRDQTLARFRQDMEKEKGRRRQPAANEKPADERAA